MENFKKLLDAKNFKWLLRYSKPFIWMIGGIIIINILVSVFGVGSAVLSKYMIDSAVAGFGSQAVFYIVVFVAAQVTILILGAVSGKVSIKLSEKMSYLIQDDIINRIYMSDWMKLNGFHSGDVLTRLTDDVESIVRLWISTLPGIISLGLQLVLAFGVLLYFDPLLAVFAFVLGPVAIIISFLIGQRLKKIQHEVQGAESRYRSYLTELVQNILIIKSFQYEKKSIEKVRNMQGVKYGHVLRRANMGIAAGLVLSGGYWMGYVLAFIYGVFKLARKTATFGTFTAFLQLVEQVHGPFMGLASSMPQVIASFASVERLVEIEEIKPEEASAVAALPGAGKGISVILKGIGFGYVPDKKVLTDTSLYVEEGNIIALIGSSGEGKTTIMRLLLGLLRPDAGEALISIDEGENITVSASTRAFFTYVPQGNTLFSGTIKENLKVGNPDATDDELEEALKVSCAWDFIDKLPERMETLIGESASGLSEGQAQRICIARAILRPSPVMLLDEATSALDMETEKRIFENIRGMKTKTCIVVTHRLSVLPLCDAIYRLENGRLYKHDTKDFSSILINEQVS